MPTPSISSVTNESAVGSTPPCNLCGGTEVEQVGERDRHGRSLRTVICRACGLVWTDPRPTAEETRKFYSKDYRVAYKAAYAPKPKHALRETRRALERVQKISSLLTPGQKFLDVGCGGGFFLYTLRQRGIDAQGIEPNEGFADYAQSELNVPVQNAFLQDVDFPAATFDFISLNHVLEHVEDPAATLTRLTSWLKPHGYLLVEVPNVESRHHSPGNRFHIGHLYNFNPRTLIRIGYRSGLDLYQSQVLPGTMHCHVIFQKPETVGPVAFQTKSVYNYNRIRSVLKSHTSLTHFSSPSLLLRTVRKQWNYLREWTQTRNAGSGRTIVDDVIRRAR